MPKQLTYDRARLEWVEFRPHSDGTFGLRLAVRLADRETYAQAQEYSGWDGVTAAQRTALRNALGAALRARVVNILGTDTSTQDLQIAGGDFVEVRK